MQSYRFRAVVKEEPEPPSGAGANTIWKCCDVQRQFLRDLKNRSSLILSLEPSLRLADRAFLVCLPQDIKSLLHFALVGDKSLSIEIVLNARQEAER